MRLFIAIDFNGLKEYFDELNNKIDDSLARMKKTNDFHLTLKFLGEISDDKIKLIKDRLSKINFDKFTLVLDKIGVFPNENHINVIWVGVKPDIKLKDLQTKIEESLKEFNFKKEFEFHPHITLARVKFINDKDKFVSNLNEIKVGNKRLVVENFRLVKSELRPNGPVYEDIYIFQ